MANRTKRTAEKRRIILDTIAQGLTVAEAARAAGVGRRLVFEWRKDDPEFARDYEEAYETGTDAWEAEGRRRAFTDDTALFIFLMKARDPQRFNRKMIAVGGDLDKPLVVHRTGGPDEVVHFFMPPNGRDRPEEVEDESPPTIEGEAEPEADAA